MTHRTTITFDDEVYLFLNDIAGDNRSAYINELLKQERKNFLKQALIKANREEAADLDSQEELQAWESTLSDGLSNLISSNSILLDRSGTGHRRGNQEIKNLCHYSERTG